MFRSLDRLLRPATVALIGGGWTTNVADQLHKTGFEGEVVGVNPRRDKIGVFDCVASETGQ